MVICIRTTLNIPDALAEEAKRVAVERGRTFTDLIVEGLRIVIDEEPTEQPPIVLPTFDGGPISDEDRALLDALLRDNEAMLEFLEASEAERG